MKRYLATVVVAVTFTMLNLASAQTTDTKTIQKYPDVVNVKVHARGANRFDFDATISSPYDSPQRYADAFRVMRSDGVVYGERTLFHDHAGEQPFTRDLYGVTIPAGVQTVVVQARDQKYGYGGKTLQVKLPGR
ncbi:MAG: hypothetical protein ACYCZA_06020 [Thiobacillus sp.]